MEDEIFDSINNDLLSEYDSELGDPLKSEKVATKVSKIWSNPNIKGLNKSQVNSAEATEAAETIVLM